MSEIWIEKAEGYFYPYNDNLSHAIKAKLQMLCFDGFAEECKTGVMIPFQKSVILSEEDAELLAFPSRNPYRISVRTEGNVGNTDLRYIIEIIRPDGQCFVSPKINGALLHINSDTIYRLNADQYSLVKLAQESNSHIAELSRKQAMEYNLSKVYHIQRHAIATDAKLDDYLSIDNMKIVVPDRLDVEFQMNNADEAQVQPILLSQNEKGNLFEINVKEFQEIFNKRRDVQGIYMGKDRTRYICSDTLQKGLKQIKSVGKISKADVNRYQKQPKELFTEAVFDFESRDYRENTSDILNSENSNWLYEEGNIENLKYSNRIIGIEKIVSSNYYGLNIYKTDWLNAEGQEYPSKNEKSISNIENVNVKSDNNDTTIKSKPSISSIATFNNVSDTEDDEKLNKVNEDKTKEYIKKKLFALKIKPNIERIDYVKKQDIRGGDFLKNSLLPGITLLNHQIYGINWIFEQWKNGYNGVLLADDMGLGKTLQTLVFIASLKKSGFNCNNKKNRPILIVAPTALLANWQNEYERFIQKDIFDSVIYLQGNNLIHYATDELTPNKKKKLSLTLSNDCLALTTYETLRDYQFSFAEVDWSIIIADEVQKIKNPSAGITKALKAMKHDYTICLSGTPVENSWIDLWSIMDFVQPAWLGDLTTFKSNYISRLSNNKSTQNVETIGKELKNNLAPLFLRRMKTENLSGMPSKNIYSCPEEMPTYQKQCYLSVLESIRRNKEIHPLKIIAELRDISLHPDLSTNSLQKFFESSPDEVINKSARLKKTFALLDEIKRRDEKVLVFVISRKMQLILINLVEKKFHLKMLPPINGTMNGSYRQEIVNKFNQSIGFNVLILSPDAAGIGFTITSANNVIHLSRMWNPAKEDQATDRVYRIGQTKNVNIYLPMSCHKDFGLGGSFDEKLDALLSYKRMLSENVLFPTSDNANDGMAIFQSLKPKNESEIQACYWKIKDVDSVTGDVFEKIITDLYNAIVEYDAIKTPHSNDYGADVIVIDKQNNSGLLIQCKHRENINNNVGNKAVQEIYAAIPYYEQKFKGIKFKPVVITNAMNFTKGSYELAKQTHTQLIPRNILDDMLTKYEVIKCL